MSDVQISDGFIYIFMYVLLSFFAFIEAVLPISQNAKKGLASFSLFLLWLILSLRWTTGTDWNSYHDLFTSTPLLEGDLASIEHFDNGFLIENYIIRQITDSYTVFLFFNSAIAIYLLKIFINRTSSNPNVSVLCFFAGYFVAHYMGSNRRILSIGFTLIFYIYCVDRKFLRATIYQILAFAFHRTSIVATSTLLLLGRTFCFIKMSLLFILCFSLGALEIPIKAVDYLGSFASSLPGFVLLQKMEFYGETAGEHVSGNIDLYAFTILSLIKRGLFLSFFALTLLKRENTDESHFLLNIYSFGLCIYGLFIGLPVMQSLSTYFCIVEIALIGNSFAVINKRPRIILTGFIIIYAGIQLLGSLSVYPDLYLPYISIFDGAERWNVY